VRQPARPWRKVSYHNVATQTELGFSNVGGGGTEGQREEDRGGDN
jgi:hypothetical protein